MAQRNDIEDVLSSIRRLVAHEAGSAIEVEAARALVLDQTQRVTEPEDPFQAVQGLPEPALEDGGPEQAPDVVKAPNSVTEDSAPRLAMPEPEVSPDMMRPETDGAASEPDATETDVGPVDLADLSPAVECDEALRELIAEIVRQELAGALGERITRNVRKLVRRELRLMMSGEEFD